jgi:serine/threonine protein kinase
MKDKTLSTSTKGGGAAGTLHWMAPELLDGDDVSHTEACDIYSLAIVFWELAMRMPPYEGKTAKEIYKYVVLQEEREEIPQDCPAKFRSLITQCWSAIPAQRPSTKAIIEDLETQRQALGSGEATTGPSGYRDNTDSMASGVQRKLT